MYLFNITCPNYMSSSQIDAESQFEMDRQIIQADQQQAHLQQRCFWQNNHAEKKGKKQLFKHGFIAMLMCLIFLTGLIGKKDVNANALKTKETSDILRNCNISTASNNDEHKTNDVVLPDDRTRLNDFYIDFTKNGSYASIEEFAKKHHVCVGHIRDPYGNEYYKIASTEEDALLRTTMDCFSGMFFIIVSSRYLENKDSINEIVYVDNERLVKATQVPKFDIQLMDYNRLTPAEDRSIKGKTYGSALLAVSTPEEVVNYKPNFNPPISPLEELFGELQHGSTLDELVTLATSRGLYYSYNRYESFITYADLQTDSREISHIKVEGNTVSPLKQAEYIYYPAYKNGGWILIYATEDDVNNESELFSEGEGFYLKSDSTSPKKVDTLEEAVSFLREQRPKY